MSRVFSMLFRKTPREIVSRRMSSETSEASKWEERKLQMQLQHELTMKRLELDQKELELAQKRGLEIYGVSRETANLLTVGGTCVVIVSSGAWLVSQILKDIKVNLLSLQREVFSHEENFRSLISAEHYPEKSSSEQPDNKKSEANSQMPMPPHGVVAGVYTYAGNHRGMPCTLGQSRLN